MLRSSRCGLCATSVALILMALVPSCGSSDHSAGSTNDGGSSGASNSGSGSSGGMASGSGSGLGSGSSSGPGAANPDGSTARGSDASSSGSGGDAGGGACLGSSLLTALGKSHLIVGGMMQDATAKLAPFDLRYIYVSGGLFDGASPCTSCASNCTTNSGAKSCAGSGGCSWWGCWQYDQDPPGAYARSFASTCQSESPPQVPMFTYYEILQASGVQEGAAEVTQAATNASLMTRYFADWRFLLQQIGQNAALLHIEPDFWGYAEQHGADPTALPAAVASANATDCGSLPNTIAGMGKCMIAMVRKYAPHAFVGLHASAWGTNMDVTLNTSASFDVAGEAKKLAAFLAACGETNADFVVVETSDRDAGYYQTQSNQNTWWDASNATLPSFHQDFTWVQALTEALGKPALYWQTPLGNMTLPNAFLKDSMGNVTGGHWKDNRVDYFFGHMNELAAAHVVGVAYGAGAGDQTSPETDGGNFVAKAKSYFATSSGGKPLCP